MEKQVVASASRGPGSGDQNEHSKIWPVSADQKQTWCSRFVLAPGFRPRVFAIARVGTSLRISKTLNKSILGAPCVYVLSMGQTCSLRVSSHRRRPSLEIQQRRLNELSYHERGADVVHMIIIELVSEMLGVCYLYRQERA